MGSFTKETKKMVIDAFKSSRNVINIPYNNWLLFAGTIEAFMVKFTDDADFARIEYALNKHMEWYVGDGLYSDGNSIIGIITIHLSFIQC